jgi:uncharacterized protein YbjT (DUF2867 family)
MYLCGPELRSQRDAVGVIGKALGKDVRVEPLDEQAGFEGVAKQFGEAGVPEAFLNDAATFFVDVLRGRTPDDTYNGCVYVGPAYKEGQDNILEYGG